jgi:hypothetical protein
LPWDLTSFEPLSVHANRKTKQIKKKLTYNMNDGLPPYSKTYTSKKGKISHRWKQRVGNSNNEQVMNDKQKRWWVFEASTNRRPSNLSNLKR